MISCGTTTVASKDASINELAAPSDLPTTRNLKKVIAVSRFTNSSKAAKGAFYNKGDSVINAAYDILVGRLQSTDKFIILEATDYDFQQEENVQKTLAQYVLVGSITSIGRKTEGTSAIIGHSKEQIAEATVSVRLIDISTDRSFIQKKVQAFLKILLELSLVLEQELLMMLLWKIRMLQLLSKVL